MEVYMKRILLLLFIFCLFVMAVQLAVHLWLSTSAPQYAVFDTRQFEVIAHQGGGGVSPPNTLTAMRAALAAGADVLEMDIRLSRDGQIVVIHDQTLDRTTSCKGKVRDRTLAELRGCDKGFHFKSGKAFPFRNLGIEIPTLKDVFRSFPGQRMIIEIKHAEPSLVPEFCQMIRSFDMQEHLVIGSFRQKPIDDFRKTCPEVATSATLKEATLFVLTDKMGLSGIISPVYTALQILPLLKISSMPFLPEFNIVTPSLVEQAHAKGIVVQVWTVNEARQMKSLFAMGVDGIMTDYPARLVDAIPER